MKTAYLLIGLVVLTAGGCDKPSDLSTGVEQPPKSKFNQNPATLPTTTAAANPSTPTLDSPNAEPAEDPQARGSSHTPRALDQTDGGLTSDPTAAKTGANPNKRNATKPIPQ